MKKHLSILIVFVMLLINVCPIIPAAVEYEIGDVNLDGDIDIYDCLIVKAHLCGIESLTKDEIEYADIDENGAIEMLDYLTLRRIVIGNLNDKVTITRKEAISFGKSYTTSISADANYPDNYELTDGAIASSASYLNGAFAGYTSSVEVVIDLGDDGKKISGMELSYLHTNEAGILPPTAVTFYGSNSATDSWEKISTIGVPSFTAPITIKSVKLDLTAPVNYRYIKFSIKKASYWLFIDECIVYGEVSITAEDNTTPTPANSYKNDTLTDANRQSNLASVYSGNIYNKNLGLNLISKNKSMSTSTPAGVDSRCGTTASVLANGAATGSAYDSGQWYGINASSASYVMVNLGAVYNNLCSFKIHCFNRENSKISLPAYVDFEVSSNGYNFTNIGRMYSYPTENENYVFVLNLDTLVRGSYVRFKLPAGNNYYWIEEIQVYQNAAASSTYVYGDFEMTFSNNERYWKNPANAVEKFNLISALPAEIIANTQLSLTSYGANNSSESDSKILTDGKTTEITSPSLAPWFGFYGGKDRSIFYDFGAISSVSDFSVRALKSTTNSINLPSSVKLILSENGHEWFEAGELTLSASDNSIAYATKELDREYKARYAAIYFELAGGYVYLDEITIIGKKDISYAVSLKTAGLTSHDYPDNTEYTKPSDDLLGGAEDVLLLYHNLGVMNEDFLLPYVAYMDQNGSVLDTMYDGFLFLTSPGSGYLPSGGTPYGTNTAEDWNYLYTELVTANKNLDALEKVTGKVKKLLNKPDYTVKVFITIPHIDNYMSAEAFGDINGDGINENVSQLQTRVNVALYYVQRYLDFFQARKFQNIELGGFYWFHETIARYSDDAYTAQALNKALDEMDIDLFWIPYYQATGYSYWKEYGFDAAFYQPNYAFSSKVEESRLSITASTASSLGMSVEMEIDGSALGDIRYFKKYMDYLRGGVVYGYMDNAINMFYQAYDDISTAAFVDNPRVRLIYEYTYRFIKDELDIKPDTVDELQFTAVESTPCYGSVVTDKNSEWEYRVGLSPDHGSLAFDAYGNFVYYPNKGFTGTDTFTYQITNYLGWSEDCVVTITVN